MQAFDHKHNVGVTRDEWPLMMEFAHYINCTSALNTLMNIIPDDIDFQTLLQIGDDLHLITLQKFAAESILHSILSDDTTIIPLITLITIEQFTVIHQRWTELPRGSYLSFVIFLLTHYYFSNNIAHQSKFIHFIAETPFDLFSPDAIKICIDLPLIKNTITDKLIRRFIPLINAQTHNQYDLPDTIFLTELLKK